MTGRGLGDDPERMSYPAQEWKLGEVVDPEPGHEHLVGRLSIPYATTSGVVDIKFRCVKHADCKARNCVKYLGLDGTAQDEQGLPRAWLFNAKSVLDAADMVVITEGELDAIAVEVIADIPAVGVPGSTIWPKCKHWVRVFDGLKVLVLADGDKAGVIAAKAIASSLPEAQVIRMPDGHDANSYLVEHGAEAFYERCGL